MGCNLLNFWSKRDEQNITREPSYCILVKLIFLYQSTCSWGSTSVSVTQISKVNPHPPTLMPIRVHKEFIFKLLMLVSINVFYKDLLAFPTFIKESTWNESGTEWGVNLLICKCTMMHLPSAPFKQCLVLGSWFGFAETKAQHTAIHFQGQQS